MEKVISKRRHPDRGGQARQRPCPHPDRWRDVLARIWSDAAARERTRVAIHCVSLRSARARGQRQTVLTSRCSARSMISMQCCSLPAARRWCLASRPARRSRPRPSRQLRGIRRLALYEAPYVIDDTHEPLPPTFIADTQGTGRRRQPQRGGQEVHALRRHAGDRRVRHVAAAVLEEVHEDRAHLVERPRDHRAASQRQALSRRQVGDRSRCRSS